jgi:ABC-type transport system substrate-binding protein
MLDDLNQTNTGSIKSISLKANNKYYNKVSYISNINFQFFDDKDELIKAANQKSIDGFSFASLDENEALIEKEVKQGWSKNEKFAVYSFSLPRYFAVFFNTQKARILSDGNITKALNYSVNKQELIDKIKLDTKSNVSIVNSPILPEYFGYSLPEINYSFDLDRANALLDKSGYKDNGSLQRAKPNNKKPAFQFKTYLKIGSKGNDVTELQGCLARLDDNFKNILQGETGGTFGKATDSAVTEFQKKYMLDSKPTGETGPATRTKLNELCLTPQDNSFPLKFTLVTIDQPQLVKVANMLKDYWQKVGVTVDVKAIQLSELKQVIKQRDYDALLYGESLGSLPDLYPFWHSSQINDPGLNLSEYQNKDVDQLLKDARETLANEIKVYKYAKMQDIILSECPALFLYNPDYVYWVSGKISGVDTTKIVDPAKRFANITNWYIQTHRVWK